MTTQSVAVGECSRVAAGDTPEPVCPWSLPVRAEGASLVDAEGVFICLVEGEADVRRQGAAHLAWVINSHLEVSDLQRRLERLAFARRG